MLNDLDGLDWDSALFINQSAWVADPWHAKILVLEGDDELEDVAPGTHLPKIAKDRGMRQLFDMETFREIVNFERKRNPVADVKDVIYAINYYREKDDFYSPYGWLKFDIYLSAGIVLKIIRFPVDGGVCVAS